MGETDNSPIQGQHGWKTERYCCWLGVGEWGQRGSQKLPGRRGVCVGDMASGQEALCV